MTGESPFHVAHIVAGGFVIGPMTEKKPRGPTASASRIP
jgi:hypothetical protein